jgi:DNA modification methylase
MNVFDQAVTEHYALYHGDCIEVVPSLPSDSVHLTIFSPPFSSLYIYSESERDMGNCADDDEFFVQFDYLIPELYRVTVPGRLCAVHCKNLVNYKGRDGKAGIRDFRGEIIRHFQQFEWAYHSEVCIWKDPVIEMQRTKAHGLLYKQLRRDSSFSRQGLAEYLLLFRKWPDSEDATVEPVTHFADDFPLEMWQRYASPVWFDISQTRVLNVQIAREAKDEKHLCPLQLDVIERSIDLWTNPGDSVLDPFAGIGSTGHIAIGRGRKSVGVELKESYYKQAIRNYELAVQEKERPMLFDLDEVPA